MQIGMIQIKVSDQWQDNLKQALEGIEQCAKAQADLCILPELWNTPFINSEIVRHDHQWDLLIKPLQKAAREHGLWIAAGTLPYTDEKGNRYNRSAIIGPDGQIAKTCDKLHLLEVHTARHSYYEKDVFVPGNKLVQIDLPWTRAGVLICYDIRFPEAARLVSQDARLLIVMAGFNEKVGEKHWKHLLCTRAMENEIFVAGVNPARNTYPSYTSYGHSMICSPDGEVIYEMDASQLWSVTEIDLDQVDAIRHRSPFWKLRRKDLYVLEEKENEDD